MPDEEQLHGPWGGKVASRRVGRAISAQAGRQHGVVSRPQLRAAGAGDDAIDGWIARGWLIPFHRGVYALGHRLLTVEGRWMAAVLAGGSGAALSQESAADHWELTGLRRPLAHVTVARRRMRRAGVRFHRAELPADEITVHAGIPVTTVARTVLDLAAVTRPARLEQAIGRAEHRGLADSPSLPDLMARHPRRRGAGALRRILERGRLGLDVADHELEVRFAEFVAARRLPRPELNVTLVAGGRRRIVDCLWREAGLIVELDSHEHHGDAAAFEADRARDLALVAAGWVVVRVTWRRLHLEPDALEAQLRSALSRRGAA